MEGSLTFDVLVLSGKSQWTSISRWPDAMSAQNEARNLVATKKHLGVKVSQESFDHADNQFKEKTLFKHLKGDKIAAAQAQASASGFAVAEDDDFDEFGEFGDFDDYDDGPDWVVPVFGLFTVLAVILGLGIFFFDGKIDIGNIGKNEKSDYFVFALPAVITNVSSGAENFSVRIDLQLELDGAHDAKAVELALAQIMESAIDEIQATDAGDLNRSKKLQLLRAQLEQKIQDAMGETNLNGVLFNNIQIF